VQGFLHAFAEVVLGEPLSLLGPDAFRVSTELSGLVPLGVGFVALLIEISQARIDTGIVLLAQKPRDEFVHVPVLSC